MPSPTPHEPQRENENHAESDLNFDEDKRYLKKVAREKIGSTHQPLIEASDLVQETLFEAVRHRELLQTMSRRTRLHWMRKVLVNRLTDLIRRMKTARRGGGHVATMDTNSPSLSNISGLLDPTETPSKIVSKWEEEDRVRAAIDALSETDRFIILARDFDGLDYATIGLRHNLTPEATRKRYERALARLAALLAPPNGDSTVTPRRSD